MSLGFVICFEPTVIYRIGLFVTFPSMITDLFIFLCWLHRFHTLMTVFINLQEGHSQFVVCRLTVVSGDAVFVHC